MASELSTLHAPCEAVLGWGQPWGWEQPDLTFVCYAKGAEGAASPGVCIAVAGGLLYC